MRKRGGENITKLRKSVQQRQSDMFVPCSKGDDHENQSRNSESRHESGLR